jgi:hypothetical protein
MPNVTLNDSILQAALEGLERRRADLNAKVEQVRSLLDGSSSRRGPGRPRKNQAPPDGLQAPARKKRHFSIAARKRLADAMRRRWAVKRTAAQAKAGRKR